MAASGSICALGCRPRRRRCTAARRRSRRSHQHGATGRAGAGQPLWKAAAPAPGAPRARRPAPAAWPAHGARRDAGARAVPRAASAPVHQRKHARSAPSAPLPLAGRGCPARAALACVLRPRWLLLSPNLTHLECPHSLLVFAAARLLGCQPCLHLAQLCRRRGSSSRTAERGARSICTAGAGGHGWATLGEAAARQSTPLRGWHAGTWRQLTCSQARDARSAPCSCCRAPRSSSRAASSWRCSAASVESLSPSTARRAARSGGCRYAGALGLRRSAF